MKNAFLVIVVIIFTSCGNKSSQIKSSNFKEENFKKVKVDFLEQEILIPKNYTEISIDRLLEKLKEIKRDTIFLKAAQEGIKKLKLMPTEFVIFADKTNFENCLSIQSGEFIDFDKSIASQYIGMLEEQVSQDWSRLGLNYERVESKLMTTEKSKIIKVKYRQEIGGYKKYQTQYIITSNDKTFGVVVSNYGTIDFEQAFKRI